MRKNEPDYIFPFLWMRDQSEEVLRNEIEKIYDCGIRSICLESRPHPDFGGDGWWHDFDIVLEEAHKRDMRIWILDDAHFPTGQANGAIPKNHPELARKYVMMQHTDCAGPVPYATLDVNLMMTKQFTWMDFGKKIDKPLIDEQKLLSVTAYKVIEGNILSNEYIDLTGFVENGILTWDVPAGVWRICVSFTTYDFGARNDYINYIDEQSVRTLIDAIYEPHYAHYKEEFGKTIAGFFSDEPGFYNVNDFAMDDRIGKKKMALPWCDEIEPMMEGELGADWRCTLPMMWMQTEEERISSHARKCYMDLVSTLFAKNFSHQLGNWCEEHNVLYIGHVIEDNGEHCRLGNGAGHYFRAVSGQHMAGIDTIGGQILPGNPYAERHGITYVGDGVFNHFGLAKLGASAAQTDPRKKGRFMCESFGAYGWNFGVKSMKWLVDYLLIQGVNHLVPHAFSMAEYPDADCPPHFYAGGNNPEYPYFAELMKYANKMCQLFNDGKNVPVTAILYPAETEWMNDSMQLQLPARQLMEHQIDFELLPVDVFTEADYYGTSMEHGIITVNERHMRTLVVPETGMLDVTMANVILKALEQQVSVVFVNRLPEAVAGTDTVQERKLLEKIAVCDVVKLEQLQDYFMESDVWDMKCDTEQKNLVYYHYKKEDDIYFLFNTSLSEDVNTKIMIKTDKKAVRYDIQKDCYYEIPQSHNGEMTELQIVLKPYESILLVMKDEVPENLVTEQAITAEASMDISENWAFSKTRAINYPFFGEEQMLEKLVPVSSFAPEFAGVMSYGKTVTLPTTEQVYLEPEYIYEAAEVFVNGESAGKCLTPPYRWNLSGLVKEGENNIRIEVVNTPTRDTLTNPGPFGPEREMLEPSGMFGKIMIQYR